MNFNMNGTKVQPLYIVEILKKYTDRDHFLTKEGIAEKLRYEGYCPLRKKDGKYVERSVDEIKSISKDLDMLLDMGFKIHGLEPEIDEETGEEIPTRGKIWIEKEISDEKLQMLIDTIVFSNFIEKSEAKELIDALISINGSACESKKSASSRIDGGQVYHQDKAEFFKELKVINQAMGLKEPKKVAFKYAQYKYNNDKFILEKVREHIVSPYHFVIKKGYYYLIGYNHKKECLWHYRLDYVKDVKILKELAKERSETELYGKDIGKYVLEHPYMFAGTPKGIEVRVSADRLGIIHDTFGTAFTKIKENGDTVDFRVYCTEEDAFHWAMQYGSHIEVLKPQSLRDRIRYHVESMTFRYKCSDGDRYSQEIKKARRGLHLELKGIDLSRRTEHFKLNKIYRVFLSDNNLTDITFLENYPELCEISLKNNNVSDLSILGTFKNLETIELYNLGDVKNIDFIANLNKVKKLIIDFDRDVDLSKLNNIKGLEYLAISERCSFNLSFDLDKIERENPKIKIKVFDREYNRNNKDLPKYMLEPFYRIMLKIAFGFFVEFGGDENEMSATVEEMIQKLPLEEKEIIELMYREKLSKYEISVKLNKSEDEVQRLRMSALSKISHESFNEKLKKFIIHK